MSLKLSFPTFRQPSEVVFACGSLKSLSQVADDPGTLFFLSGDSTVGDIVSSTLQTDAGFLNSDRVFIKPTGEPTREMVTAGANRLKQVKEYDRIVGIGGGSTLDWCRLVWAEATGRLTIGDQRVAVEKDESNGRPEIWLVPTTCATGAEAASVAVFSDRGKKRPVVSDAFLADRVVLDGRFLTNMSRSALANSLSDVLSHAIEAFVSIISGALAKDAASGALKRVLGAYHQPLSRSDSEQLMEAGYLGGIAASNCSVGIVHAFAHTLGTFGVPHGHANSLALLAGIRFNSETEQMAELLVRSGFDDVRSLGDAVRPIVADACDPKDFELLSQLKESKFRQAICAGMMEDVCIRTNPRRASIEDCGAFLDDVVETLQSL